MGTFVVLMIHRNRRNPIRTVQWLRGSNTHSQQGMETLKTTLEDNTSQSNTEKTQLIQEDRRPQQRNFELCENLHSNYRQDIATLQTYQEDKSCQYHMTEAQTNQHHSNFPMCK